MVLIVMALHCGFIFLLISVRFFVSLLKETQKGLFLWLSNLSLCVLQPTGLFCTSSKTFSAAASDITMPEDTGIEPRAADEFALKARPANC